MKKVWYAMLFTVAILLISEVGFLRSFLGVKYVGYFLEIASLLLFIWDGIQYDTKPVRGHLSNWFGYQIPIRISKNYEYVTIFYWRTILLLVILAVVNGSLAALYDIYTSMHYMLVAITILSTAALIMFGLRNLVYREFLNK